MEEAEASVADHADGLAYDRLTAGDRGEAGIRAPGHGLFGQRFHRAPLPGVTGTRAWAAAGSSIARSETPSP